MVNFINSWAKGIIVAVIISTIVEMIIPNGNIKKYIKTVIGVYMVFTIISPIVSKITGKEIKLSNYINSVMGEYDIRSSTVSLDTDKYIKETYKENLEKEIKEQIKEKGYEIDKIKLEIEESGEEYGKINRISLVLNKKDTNVETIEISVGNREEREKSKLTEAERQEIRVFLAEEYGMSTENIKIN